MGGAGRQQNTRPRARRSRAAESRSADLEPSHNYRVEWSGGRGRLLAERSRRLWRPAGRQGTWASWLDRQRVNGYPERLGLGQDVVQLPFWPDYWHCFCFFFFFFSAHRYGNHSTLLSHKTQIFSFRLYRKSSLKVAQPTATTFLSRLRKTKDDDQSIRSGGSNQGNK